MNITRIAMQQERRLGNYRKKPELARFDQKRQKIRKGGRYRNTKEPLVIFYTSAHCFELLYLTMNVTFHENHKVRKYNEDKGLGM